MRGRLLVLLLVVSLLPSCMMLAPNTTKVMEPVSTPLALAVAADIERLTATFAQYGWMGLLLL